MSISAAVEVSAGAGAGAHLSRSASSLYPSTLRLLAALGAAAAAAAAAADCGPGSAVSLSLRLRPARPAAADEEHEEACCCCGAAAALAAGALGNETPTTGRTAGRHGTCCVRVRLWSSGAAPPLPQSWGHRQGSRRRSLDAHAAAVGRRGCRERQVLTLWSRSSCFVIRARRAKVESLRSACCSCWRYGEALLLCCCWSLNLGCIRQAGQLVSSCRVACQWQCTRLSSAEVMK